MLPRLYRLAEAADMLGGGLTKRSLRRMAKQGKLRLEVISGGFYVTEQALKDMVERCQDDASQPDCTSGEVDLIGDRLGSFSTDRVKRALDAAKMTVQALKMPSKDTLPKGIVRLIRSGRRNFSSPK